MKSLLFILLPINDLGDLKFVMGYFDHSLANPSFRKFSLFAVDKVKSFIFYFMQLQRMFECKFSILITLLSGSGRNKIKFILLFLGGRRGGWEGEYVLLKLS